jgi:glycerol-3-phosphate dehydrogenase
MCFSCLCIYFLGVLGEGLHTALVEKEDFSAGTSSRSTKLIHGGVRYLQKAIMNLDREQYNLVCEALHERHNFLEIAPHLSSKLPILLPVYKWWQLPYFFMGIKMYDFLSGKQLLKSSYIVGKSRALEKFPMLKKESLVGGIVYYDGQQNDSRMNLALALTAAREGTIIANHVEVTGLVKEQRQMEDGTSKEVICGARMKDTLTGDEWVTRAKCVVNATGPFTDVIRKMDDPNAESMCQLSSGIHIVMPDYYSPPDMGLLDPSTKDGRVIFFLPWQGSTVVGTTDTVTELTDNPKPSEAEIRFVLDEIQRYLNPGVQGQLFTQFSASPNTSIKLGYISVLCMNCLL